MGDGTPAGCEAAASAQAANKANAVWECYVAGLDPTDAAQVLTTEISFENGTPLVSWTPDLNKDGAKSMRAYTVEGKTTLTEEWGKADASSRFFRVKVSIPPEQGAP